MTYLWKIFTSLRLTVILLGFCVVLVFLGTLAQIDEGLYGALARWFRSYFVLRRAGDPLYVPPIFPGGYLLGILLLVNLTAAHIKRFKFTWRQAGINLTHTGIILLLLGQLITDQFAQESILSFREGETRHFSEATQQWELAFVHPLDERQEQVVAIPEALLRDGAELRDPKLPFTIRVRTWWINSEPAFRAPMQQTDPPISENGIAKDWDFHAIPETKKMDERNNPTAILELAGAKGEVLGTWVVSAWASDAMMIQGVRNAYARTVGADSAQTIADKLGAPQELEAGGVKWRMTLRAARFYKPFSVTLLKTTHDTYPGSEIPKDFRSRIRIDNPDTGEKREVEVYMNSPLRYEGLTFYQSTMGRDDVKDVGRSGLQVVKNPGWLTPYAGCIVVAIGMLWQFFYHLTGFIQKRRLTAATA
ncbi:MAG: cytochrome c biogenesis protein ResB [Chthoniobacteraceae bacterium]